MITALAQYIADCLLHNYIIESEKLDIYIYGFEIIISSITGFAIVLIFGLIFSKFLECILFLVIFVSLRSFCGGYHADTYFKCNSILTMTITAIMLILKFVSKYPTYIHLLIFIFSLLTMILFAPVENEFKLLDKKTKKKCKIISILLTVFFSIGTIFLDSVLFRYSIVIDATMFAITVSVLIEKIRKRGETNEKG